ALPCVQDGAVVAAAEVPADGGQRLVGELAREIHGELARPRDTTRAVAGEELGGRELEVLANRGLDVGQRSRPGLAWVERVEDVVRELSREGAAGERGESDDTDERALE